MDKSGFYLLISFLFFSVIFIIFTLINLLYTPTDYSFIIKVTSQSPLDYVLILTCLFSEEEYYPETLLLGLANRCNPAAHTLVPSCA